MIQFTQDGQEYWFDANEKESNYDGDSEEMRSVLDNIESLAYTLKAPDEVIDGDDTGMSTPEERVYDPSEAESIVKGAVRSIDGFSLMTKGKPQIIDRNRVVTDVGLLLKRTYVNDPSEVPPGVTLHEGERGGLWYDDSSQDFAQTQMENDMERLEEYDFTDEQIQEGAETLSRIDSKANDIFGNWLEVAMENANVTGASHRTKSLGSALEKVYDRKPENYDSVADLDDAHGSMIKVESISEAEDIYDQIQDEFDVIEAEDKYGDGPYRAHHIIADIDGDSVELQIKQEDLSDVAHASHALTYKPQTAPIDQMETLDEPADEPMQEELNQCLESMADYLEGLDNDVSCADEAFDIIQEFFEVTAS